MDYLYLGLMVFAAGFVDALAGGGGLITLPSYIAFGLSPALLLGTNKLSSCMGTTVAAYKFRKKLNPDKKLLLSMACLALVSGAAGAGLSRVINPQKLKFVILAVLPLSAYFVITHKNETRSGTRKETGLKQSGRAARFISAAVALYDGFLGPGAGTMYASFLTRYCGFDLVQATAVTKILNLCSNVFALAVFLFMNAVDVKLGLAMGACGIVGSALGVFVGKKRGAAVIKPLIILVCAALVLKYLCDIFIK